MGLFDKLKAKVSGKKYLKGFTCPRCGDKVYIPFCEKYTCESCGELTGDAYYSALRYDLEQQGMRDYLIDDYINLRKEDVRKENEKKEFLDNYQKNLEEEARLCGDPRPLSKYHWLDYADEIILGMYTTSNRLRQRDSKGRVILEIYPKENDPKEAYRFYVGNKSGDNIGEGDVFLSIYITAKEFFVDKKKTTKDKLYIIAKDVKAEVHQTGLSYIAQDNPHLYKTKYGGIYETLDYFADKALERFRQEVIDIVYKYLRGAKHNYYGFDDITFNEIYFEQ